MRTAKECVFRRRKPHAAVQFRCGKFQGAEEICRLKKAVLGRNYAWRELHFRRVNGKGLQKNSFHLCLSIVVIHFYRIEWIKDICPRDKKGNHLSKENVVENNIAVRKMLFDAEVPV